MSGEVQAVIARLTREHPEVPAAEVRSTVDAMYAALTGPIRHFVPVLLEHEASEVLRHRH